MDAKYTAGEWTYGNSKGGRIFKNWRVYAGKRPICTVSDLDDSDMYNARLIAAAPELLEACALAVATIERLNRHDSANGTLDVLRAALARAPYHQ
jgi:hypothetical protein